MQRKEQLLKRIHDLGLVLLKRPEVCALMGLGSIGIERDRLDDVSDLDFFVVVDKGYKSRYIENLDWLSETYPLGYAFRNSKDGHKIMFEDGIYGEFAIFEDQEVKDLYQSEGKIIWQRKDYDSSLLIQSKGPKPKLYQKDMHDAFNEALTNLYVGLCRVHRGEKLSGYRFIETFALNNILSVLHLCEERDQTHEDDYNIERRFEKHYPIFSKSLPLMLQGYQHIEVSALNLFNFLKAHMDVPSVMENEIISLIKAIEASKV